jgi:serine protease Do
MVRVGAGGLAKLQPRARPAALGLAVRDEVRPTPTRTLRSVVVEGVSPGSAAARAGVKRGDVIAQLGDVPVTSSLDLPRALLAGGEKIALAVRRSGSAQRLELALAPPAEGAAPVAAGTGAEQVWRQLGVRLQPVPASALGHNHPQLNGGLTIGDVRAEGPAGRAGLKRGDILVGLHQWEMLTLDNVVYVLNHPDRASFSPVRFYILRGGQVHRGQLQVVD